MRERIINEIGHIEREEDVRVLFAIESGSRAWGFASTDSDWDVRFVYAHPRDWYLTINPGRDVIECPIEDDLDINGWDVRKALHLLRKGNAVLVEWLQSPITYREDEWFTGRLREVVRDHVRPRAWMHHYMSQAKRNYREYLRRDLVRTKKYLYCLRPLFACSWILRTNEAPPMEFQKLLEAEVPDPAMRATIDELVARKMAGKEVAEGPRIPMLNAYIEQLLADCGRAVAGIELGASPDSGLMDAIFREVLAR